MTVEYQSVMEEGTFVRNLVFICGHSDIEEE